MGLALNGNYEPEVTGILGEWIKQGDLAIDVGTNIGYYTLLFARQVGSSGRVIAFEPDPHSHDILLGNVAKNGYSNVELSRYALADRAGDRLLYIDSHNNLDHRMIGPSAVQKLFRLKL